MKTKYTKGEWKIKPHKIGNFNIYTDSQIDSGICDCWNIETSPEETEANTKLIAVAPELLEALNELAECDFTSGTHLSRAIIKAKEAIKKATE